MELIRVSIVDESGCVVLDDLVFPRGRVWDWNTLYSGLDASDFFYSDTSLPNSLRSPLTYDQAQQRVLELLDDQSILVGHSLENDLVALRVRFLD